MISRCFGKRLPVLVHARYQLYGREGLSFRDLPNLELGERNAVTGWQTSLRALLDFIDEKGWEPMFWVGDQWYTEDEWNRAYRGSK